MQVFRSKRSKAAVAALAMLSVLGAACGDDSNDAAATPPSEQNQSASTAQSGKAASAQGVDTGAATLRAGLTGLLTEHVYLAALATGAALRGDTTGIRAYATALNGPTDSNTADLVAAITSAYGADVGKAFDGLWRSDKPHPAVRRLHPGVAAKDDKAGQDAGRRPSCTAYAKTFGTTMNSVNDEPARRRGREARRRRTSPTLIAVIDAQKAG